MALPLTKPLLRSVCAVLQLQRLLIALLGANTSTPLIDKVHSATARIVAEIITELPTNVRFADFE